MPTYEYYCEANKQRVTVYHPMEMEVRDWGMLCYISGSDLGATEPEVPVRRLPAAPAIHVRIGDSGLKEKGFTRLVRRDTGVYENVTALDKESRYYVAGEASTLPQLHKKIRD